MQKQILTAAALMALTSMLAIAQLTPPTPAEMVADQVARLTKLLDLTSTQQASATTIFTTEQTALTTLRTSLHTARTALQTAIKSNDTGTIGTEAAQIGTLTGQQVLAQATASGAFYAAEPVTVSGAPGGHCRAGIHCFGEISERRLWA